MSIPAVVPTSDDAQQGFDYSQLGEDAEFVQRAAGNIKLQTRMAGRTLIDVGCQLRVVRSRLEHGLFMAWLEAEFGWSFRTAERFMQTAILKGKIDTVSHLNASTLYNLTARSTPLTVREAIIEQLERGAHLSESEIKTMISAAKQGHARGLDRTAVDQSNGGSEKTAAEEQDWDEQMDELIKILARAFAGKAEKFLDLLSRADTTEIVFRLEEYLSKRRPVRPTSGI